MSLDAETSKLTRLGRVTIVPKHAARGTCQILIEEFEGSNCTCRDVAALALVWAIGELQRELARTLEAPGNPNVGVD